MKKRTRAQAEKEMKRDLREVHKLMIENIDLDILISSAKGEWFSVNVYPRDEKNALIYKEGDQGEQLLENLQMYFYYWGVLYNPEENAANMEELKNYINNLRK